MRNLAIVVRGGAGRYVIATADSRCSLTGEASRENLEKLLSLLETIKKPSVQKKVQKARRCIAINAPSWYIYVDIPETFLMLDCYSIKKGMFIEAGY